MKKNSPDQNILLNKILNIHASMQKIVIEAGVQPGQYNFAIKNLHKESEEFQKEFFKWLINFYDNEYTIVKNTLDQFSGWDNYKSLNITNMPEQALLKRRQKLLRESWHKRLRPVKHEKLQKLQTHNLEQEKS